MSAAGRSPRIHRGSVEAVIDGAVADSTLNGASWCGGGLWVAGDSWSTSGSQIGVDDTLKPA